MSKINTIFRPDTCYSIKMNMFGSNLEFKQTAYYELDQKIDFNTQRKTKWL